MNFYWTQEASNNFRETVQVGKNGSCNPDVTIYYTSYGRGEFSINGGWICQEQQVGRDRRLTVNTRYGHTFNMTRRKGGGYHLNTGGFWLKYKGRTY